MGIGKNIFPNRRLQASTWCVDLHDDTDAAVFGVPDEGFQVLYREGEAENKNKLSERAEWLTREWLKCD